MSTPVQPLTLLVVAIAGWLQRDQKAAMVYLLEENRVLKARLRGKKLRLTDAERRRLAVKGKALGRKLLAEVAGIVTRETLLAWHRRLIARKWDYSERRKQPGRPRVMVEISELVVGMAKSNPKWGYTRIRGALSNLGHIVARSTIANILREHGIEPAPKRSERTPWRTFLAAHWETVAATDFFTVEVATVRRLVRCLRCLLLVMCMYPFEKKALTLHLARGEGRERYFGCNLMQRKVLASSHQHLMAEAPAKYADEGVFNLDDITVLRIPPLTQLGTPVQLIEVFGGREGFVEAVHELQSALYRETA